MTTFETLGLKPNTLKALEELTYKQPTPIQEKCIPHILQSKKDLIAFAQTGTGKTAAFSLPIIEQIDNSSKHVQAIIICPTRELCLQITKDIELFTKHHKHIDTVAIYGGAFASKQIAALQRGVQIVIGTPGRINDLINRKKLNIKKVRWLVLDEADEMLSMGFKEELDAILAETPQEKQTLLFSATMESNIERIAKNYMHDPIEISVAKKNTGAQNVNHEYYVIHASDRYDALRRIADFNPSIYAIIFCRTKRETQEVAGKLIRDHYNAETIHGDLSQDQREHVMNRFREKQTRLLVATDVAARGIDVKDLTHVINYNLPDQIEGYVHRSGRTGRADKSGTSVILVNTREVRDIQYLERKIGKQFERKMVPGGKEICEQQLFNLIEKIKQTDIDEEQIGKYLKTIEEQLAHLDRNELIKKFVSTEFNHFLSFYKDAPNLNTTHERKPHPRDDHRNDHRNNHRNSKRNIEGNFMTFIINLGFKDNFNKKDLLGLINKNPALRRIQIGQIRIGEISTIFEIEKHNKLENLIREMEKYSFHGRPIKIKPDKK